jgi:hypothetical protein
MQGISSMHAVAKLKNYEPSRAATLLRGFSSVRLAERISTRAVRQALQVEPEFAAFLSAIGFT